MLELDTLGLAAVRVARNMIIRVISGSKTALFTEDILGLLFPARLDPDGNAAACGYESRDRHDPDLCRLEKLLCRDSGVC